MLTLFRFNEMYKDIQVKTTGGEYHGTKKHKSKKATKNNEETLENQFEKK
jgi:hypothetical protein